MSEVVIVGMGANVGDDDAIVARFADVVAALAAWGPVRVSRVYRSPALTAGDPAFLNAAVAVEPALPPSQDELLDALQAIEARHGRVRERVWGPRTLDLDVLVWGPRRIATARLTVPHPRAHERSFALRPLIDLLGDGTILPGMVASIGDLAADAGPAIEGTAYAIDIGGVIAGA